MNTIIYYYLFFVCFVTSIYCSFSVASRVGSEPSIIADEVNISEDLSLLGKEFQKDSNGIANTNQKRKIFFSQRYYCHMYSFDH